MERQSENVLISVHDLWKSYGNLQVLKGLNLDIFSGETLVILGRSGVGKSVLLRQIIGIEKPDRGYIEIEGIKISDVHDQRDKHNLAKSMGMLFQGSALFDSMTVGENTGFYLHEHPDPLTNKKISEKEIKDRVAHALEMVGLEGTETKMPSDLSGGMRKRAALARLIVYRPKILLYDEPTTGLDPITAGHINELIIKTQKELKATSLVVTHDIRSAIEVGDRLAFHHDGKIAQIGYKETFLKSTDPLLQTFLHDAVLTQELLENSINKGKKQT